jgi:hypothetical protein
MDPLDGQQILHSSDNDLLVNARSDPSTSMQLEMSRHLLNIKAS